MPKLICIDPLRVGEFWKLVRRRVQLAIEETDISDFGEFETEVLMGRQLLWLAVEGDRIPAVATTHLTEVRGDKICTITACQGYERDKWLPLLDEIEGYAKREGCDRMRIYGRRGWAKVLNGYKAEFAILEKAL